jgi:hypothetical protein
VADDGMELGRSLEPVPESMQQWGRAFKTLRLAEEEATGKSASRA